MNLCNYSMADSVGSRQHGTSGESYDTYCDNTGLDSVGSRPGTSDEYFDPFCEPCEESRGRNVKTECFCKDCNQYLCTDCYTTHRSLRTTIGHVIQKGDGMPKSMADKPPRYDICDNHPKHLKDQFCCDHVILVCSACCTTSHSMCDTKAAADACQYVQPSEVDELCDVNKTYKDQLSMFLSSLDDHSMKLTEQKKTMLKEAQTTYDNVLAEINKSYQNMKAAIEAEYYSQDATVSQIKQEIKGQISRVDTEINFTNKVRGSPITVKTFLSLQESISNTRQSAAFIESLKRSLNFTSIRFEPSKDIQKFISQSVRFGSINKSSVNVDANISIPDIKLPISTKSSVGAVSTRQTSRPQPTVQRASLGQTPTAVAVGFTNQQGRPEPAVQHASLGKVKVTSNGTFSVRTQADKYSSDIKGLAITPSGQRLVVDRKNKKVKLFSQDMRFLSSVSVSGGPWDITMVNDRQAVVTVRLSLVFLEVTDTQLRIKRTVNLLFLGFGITYSKDKLIVTDGTTIHALDLGGRKLWSLGQSLFDNALYVCSNSDGRWVAVTDCTENTITVLDANNGAVITSRQLGKGGGLLGVSVVSGDNIFVCAERNIVVLSGDLQNEHVLCNLGGKRVQAMACDENKHQLMISHGYTNDDVSCLQLF